MSDSLDRYRSAFPDRAAAVAGGRGNLRVTN
ncbi:hypothetical protein BOS5A_110227 [Bosea sp. EC-HK365B]|nr:hypothetical protein BOS5A_110227 [Bosea sp. EC-HK365B]VXB70955.1 hypothetical protein BOSE127_140409 [Bosea sp. 127]